MTLRFYLTGACLLAAALLTGCSSTGTSSGDYYYEDVDVNKIKDPVPKNEPKSKYGNPASYEVFGKTYYVKQSAQGFKERGQASWYGHPFHGRRTSSGEKYDMYKMTAAHKTVPIPCYMRVTHLQTGKSIIVRVNDRGPFHDGRVVDLSYVAAKKLGVYGTGTAPVQIEVITPGDNTELRIVCKPSSTTVAKQRTLSIVPPANNTALTAPAVITPAPVTSTSIYLQVAAFNEQARAQQIVNNLQQQFGPRPNVQVTSGYSSNNQQIFRVRVGPLTDQTQVLQYTDLIRRIYPDTQPIVVK